MATVNLSDYADSVVGGDWSPAIIAALTAIKTTGGTVNIDVDVTMKSFTAPGNIAGWKGYVPLKYSGDGGAVITLNSNSTAFYENGNLFNLQFSGLHFVGSADQLANIGTAILAMPQNTCTIEQCSFSGVMATDSLIHTMSNPGPLVIRDSAFNGCGAGNALIYAEGSETVSIENCTMYDYSNFRATYYNKQGYPPYWIKAVNVAVPNSSHIPMVHLKNVRTDEGTNFCYIDGYPRVVIDQCAANLNGAVGQGIYLKNVKHAVINQFWAGYAASGTPSIKIENCGYVEISGLQVQNGAHSISIDAATEQVEITNSPGVAVNSLGQGNYSVN